MRVKKLVVQTEQQRSERLKTQLPPSVEISSSEILECIREKKVRFQTIGPRHGEAPLIQLFYLFFMHHQIGLC